MRPSVQLLSVSGFDSELGLTKVRPSLQSASESPALGRPPVSKHVRQICTSCDLDLSSFQLKIGIPLTRALGNVYIILIFLPFLFSNYKPVRTDRQSVMCQKT